MPVQAADRLKWSEPVSLAEDTGWAWPVAGAFVGRHQGALIVAGGAVSAGVPSSDRIVVFLPNGEGGWGLHEDPGWRLPASVAFGTVVSTADGVVLAGGTDGHTPSRAVLRLTWDGEGSSVGVEEMVALPAPISRAGGAVVGGTLYLADGLSSMVLALDLAVPEAVWKEVGGWAGPPRAEPLVFAQNDGADDSVYLFGGIDDAGEAVTDGWKYTPKTGVWAALAAPPAGVQLSARDAAMAYGDSHVVVFTRAGDLEPGRARAYHTITDTWVDWGEMPTRLTPVSACRRDPGIVVLGHPADGGAPLAVGVELRRTVRPFGALNIAAVVLYLLTLVAMGFFFARRKRSTQDFFVAGRRIPWWAAGLSIFGTQLSSISFMAIPAKVYMTDWLYYVTLFCIVAVHPIVVFFYLPFYRRLNVTTAYEYLEKRFNVAVRLFGSLSFILFQCGRMTIVLFLPALALSAVTGASIYLCILVMGLLATLYDALGGIEAVVWTDVLQVVVLLGGGLISLGILVTRCGGFGEVFAAGMAAGKFRMVDLGGTGPCPCSGWSWWATCSAT